MIEFTPWEKIARLNRDITVTEKIDGKNGAIGVGEIDEYALEDNPHVKILGPLEEDSCVVRVVYAQSRSRIITPKTDNHGFARWVWDNAEALARALGPGVHFGEWWGSGIARGYGLPKGEKRFSLFNTKRWRNDSQAYGDILCSGVPGLGVVPVLYEGPFEVNNWHDICEFLVDPPWIEALNDLRWKGSQAEPGFMRPEGVVIFHHAARMMFKVTLENDEIPKQFAEREAA